MYLKEGEEKEESESDIKKTGWAKKVFASWMSCKFAYEYLCKEKLYLKVDMKKEDYGFQGLVNLVDSQTTGAVLLE